MEPPIRHIRVQKERGFIQFVPFYSLQRKVGGSAQSRQLMDRKNKRCRRERREGAAKSGMFSFDSCSPILLLRVLSPSVGRGSHRFTETAFP